MLFSYFFFLIPSFLFFANFGFFFLSEEVLVFASSLFFVFLAFLSLKASARRYFFLRAYHVYACFLYGLLVYSKALGSLHLQLQSLLAKALLLGESLGWLAVALRLWPSLGVVASSLQRQTPGGALGLPQPPYVPLSGQSPSLELRPRLIEEKNLFHRWVFC